MQSKLFPSLNNIFLDFLSRDSQEIYGLSANATHRKLVNFLTEVLNVAAFMCADYCIVPPSFFVESKATREALLRRSDYLSERLVRMPLREHSLDEFWSKKEREYVPFKKQYPDVFDEKKRNYLKRYAEAIVPRNFKVSSEIITAWEEGPDVDEAWRKIIDRIETRHIERIRDVPRIIKEKGLAITWHAVNRHIDNPVGVDPRIFHHLLQRHYLNTYVRNFNLRVLTGLPFEFVDFLLLVKNLCYDYEALKGALSTLQLWTLIRWLSAPSLIKLRMTSGFFSFREAFHEVTLWVTQPRDVTRLFAIAARQLKRDREGGNLPINLVPARSQGWQLSEDQIDYVAGVLEAIAPLVIDVLKEQVKNTEFARIYSEPNSLGGNS